MSESPAEPHIFASAAEPGLTTPRAAGVAGIVFSVLFGAALVLLRQTLGRGLSTSTVLTNVTGHGSTPALLGLYAVPFAGISFLWFIGVVRDRIGEREDRFFATVFFGSGLLFVAMMFAGAAALILSISFFELVVLLFPAWVTAISVYVLLTGARTRA